MNIFLRISLVFIFLMASSEVFCQHLFVQKHPDSGVSYDIVQDDGDLIYVANSEGLLMYDGSGWKLAPLPQKVPISSLAMAPDGKIYVGSENELGFLEKDSLGHHVYVSLIPLLPDDYKEKIGFIHETEVFNNEVFFFDLEHVFVFENNEFKIFEFTTDTDYYTTLFSVKNHLYLIGQDGLYQYENSTLHRVVFHEKYKDVFITHLTDYENDTYLALDSQNRLWIFDPLASANDQLRIFQTDMTDYLNSVPVWELKYLDNNYIAVATDTSVHLFDENGALKYSAGIDIFEDSGISMTYEDRQHNLWVSTYSGGIFQIITSSPLTYFDKNHGLIGTVFSFGKKGDDLYVGTSKGIYYRESRAGFTVLPGTLGEGFCFLNHNQTLYAAHRTGVLEIKEKKVTRVITHQNVSFLCGLRKHPDRMIMSTNETGLWLLEKEANKWKKKKIKRFEDSAFNIVEDTTGYIWLTRYKKGIYKIKLNDEMDSVVSEIPYDQSKGLPYRLGNFLFCLNNGELVAATQDGIYKYNSEEDHFQPHDKFRNVLGKGFCINQLTETPEGDIYFIGITPDLTGTAGVLKRQPGGTFKLITTPFGKVSSKVSEIETYFAPLLIVNDHETWIGSEKKVLNYNHSQKTFFEEPYRTFIKNVWAKDSLILTNRQSTSNINLPFSKNSLKFEFSSFFYEEPEKTEYRYKLTGLDSSWSEWTHLKEVVFNNLTEGNYTFIVKAKNIYGNIGRPASFTFSIDPPWYRTWWAYIFYTLAFILLVVSLTSLNSRRIHRQKARLKMEVYKKTKELQELNKEIVTQNEEIVAQNEEITAINEELNTKNLEISNQAKMLKELNFTKDKLFSIISHDLRGPVNQLYELFQLIESEYITVQEFRTLIPNLKDGVRNIAALMENLLHWAKGQMNGVQVKPSDFDLIEVVKENLELFKAPAQKKDIKLLSTTPPDLRVYADKDMIRLVIRNLIGNSIKFTPAGGEVAISSRTEEKLILVSVTDTGIGLSEEEITKISGNEYFTKYGTSGEKGSGLGLMLCRDFIEKNGGSLAIESTQGTGSTFTFSVVRTQNPV